MFPLQDCGSVELDGGGKLHYLGVMPIVCTSRSENTQKLLAVRLCYEVDPQDGRGCLLKLKLKEALLWLLLIHAPNSKAKCKSLSDKVTAALKISHLSFKKTSKHMLALITSYGKK